MSFSIMLFFKFVALSSIFISHRILCEAPSQALHVVDVVNGSFVSYNDNLKTIFSQVKPGTEVAVISIAGEYRKGKSFLLNFYLQYLQYRSSNPAAVSTPGDEMMNMVQHGNHPWLRDVHKNSGFHFKSGIKRDTTGITMWPTPFLIRKSDGRELAVIVMDSQGLYDSATDANDNVRLFTMVSLLSSSLMLNTPQNINFNQLMELKYFMDYATTGSTASNQSKPFQRLTFLIRDYTLGACGWSGGQEQLDQFMTPSQHQSEDVRALAQNLTKGFEHIDSFALPFPGREVTKKTFDGSLSKIDPEFLAHVENFVLNVTESVEARTPLVVSLTAGDMINFINSVITVFNQQLSPDELMRMNERQVVTKIFALIMETVTDYELKMKEAYMTKPISYFMALSFNSIEQEVSNLHKRLKMEQIANLTLTGYARFRMQAGAGGEPVTALQMLEQQIEERYKLLSPVICKHAMDRKSYGEQQEREERDRRQVQEEKEEEIRAERERQREELEEYKRWQRERRHREHCRRCCLILCWQVC